MPKTISNYKCNICGDVFTATSEKYTSCKCGMSEVKPSEISTEYNPEKGWNCERLHDDKSKTYYNENDVYIMKDNILNLFNEVKTLCTTLDFDLYEDFVEDEDGNEYLSYINYSLGECINNNYDEQNEIQFCVNFTNRFKEDEYKNRLTTFRDFLLKLKNSEIKISDRDKILSLCDEQDIDWSREQLKKYDYEFYF